MYRRNLFLAASLFLAIGSCAQLFGFWGFESASVSGGKGEESGSSILNSTLICSQGTDRFGEPEQEKKARYEIDLGLSSCATAAEGSENSGDLASSVRLRGKVEVTSLGRRPGDGILAFRFDDLVLDVVAGETRITLKGAELGGIVGVEILVATDSEGRFESVSVPASIDADREDFLRGILSRFQVVDRSRVGSSWTVAEESDLGRVRVNYSETGKRQMEKRIKSFERVALMGLSDRSQVEGAIRIELDENRSVIRMKGKETIRSGSEKVGIFQMLRKTSIVRIESGLAISGARPLASRAVRSFGMAMTSGLKSDWTESVEAEGSLSVEDILVALREEFGVHPEGSLRIAELLDRLTRLMRHREDLFGTMVELMENETIQVRRVLIASLGAVGTPKAQEVMASFVLDVDRDAVIRMEAISSAFQVHQPTEEFVAAIGFLTQEVGSTRLRNRATLLLGTLAGRVEGPLQEDILRDLDRQVIHSGGNEQNQSLYLQALANSGLEGACERVVSYLNTDQEMVRMSAVSALGRLGGARSSIALHRASQVDESQEVRCAALQEIVRQNIDIEETRSALEIATEDVSPVVRNMASSLLSRLHSIGSLEIGR
ncbi:MAG: HEAT repeat domain-containing protein [Planctomycetota bacterium]|nr:HEAT repeat domain-containing protein [Planctomycetota bacterium]